MRVVVARNRRISSRKDCPRYRMNGVVPVVIVIGVLAVPTAVMRFERVMRPANAGVRAGNHNVLPRESKRPDLGACV